MGDATLTLVPWPEGTAVGAYPRRSEQLLDDMPPTMVRAEDVQPVAADKSLRFPSLNQGEYWAVGPVDDRYRYVAFNTQKPKPAPLPAGSIVRALDFIESMTFPYERVETGSVIVPDVLEPPESVESITGTFALIGVDPEIDDGNYVGYTVEQHVITDTDYLIGTQPASASNTFSFPFSYPGRKRFCIRNGTTLVADYNPRTGNLRSYVVAPGQPGYGTNFVRASYMYDQGVALCAAILGGRSDLARLLVQGLLNFQTDGGTHDGALVFSALQDAPTLGAAAYRTGAHAVGLFALLRYIETYPADTSVDYIDAAQRATDWMLAQLNPSYGLLTGGWGTYTIVDGVQILDPEVKLDWMSAEHNFDAYHALKLAGRVLNPSYTGTAATLGNAIQTRLWDGTREKFLQGVKGDGTPDTADPLDCHGWAAVFCVEFGDLSRAKAILTDAMLAPYANTRRTPDDVLASGYAVNYDEPGYPGALPNVWSEGTFSVAYAMARLTDVRYARTLAGIVPSQCADGSYYYVTDPDPSQELTPYRSVIGAAWAVLAVRGTGIWN